MKLIASQLGHETEGCPNKLAWDSSIKRVYGECAGKRGLWKFNLELLAAIVSPQI